MEHGILLSGADNIDFMIHGVFKYSFFGHEVWITTTHVCVLIVMLIIIGFAIVANRCMAKAREVPEGFQGHCPPDGACILQYRSTSTTETHHDGRTC